MVVPNYSIARPAATLKDGEPVTQRTQTISVAQGISLGCGLLTIWLLSHLYRGFDHDGQLYAFQALARLKPELYSNDLFLLGNSQDKYTLFTYLYAHLIEFMGLTHAAGLLMVLGQVAIAAACWWTVRRLISPRAAWFAVGFFIVIPASYGGQHVFKVAEEFLTARLLTEGLSLWALVSFLRGRRTFAFFCAAAGMLVHPLMATPCLAMLLLLCLPYERWLAAIGLGAAALVAALVLAHVAPFGPLSIMDPQWLHVVQARSTFLFINNWLADDWQRTILSFSTLAFAATVYSANHLLQRTVAAAICVGIAGLLLTALSTMTPLALLLMGQPWRWFWPAAVLSILLAGPAAYGAAKDSRIGQGCAAILLTAWAFAEIAGGALGLLALMLWHFRARIPSHYHRYVSWLSIGLAGIGLLWVLASATQVVQQTFTMGAEHVVIERLRDLFSLVVPGAAASAILIYLVICRWPTPMTIIVVLMCTVALGFLLPQTITRLSDAPYYEIYSRERDNFATWERIIPPNTNVFWYGNHIAVWMLLERPSYLSRSSSAGVVFSRETALEVQRRAQLLDPYVDADLMVAGRKAVDHESTRELTIPLLRHICSDPQLGFVVSSAHLGFGVANQSENEAFKNFQLYDCRSIPPQS